MRFTELVLVPIVILATCCGRSTPPTATAPSTTPPVGPPSPPSLIGTVVEWTPQGERPLGGAFGWGQDPTVGRC